MDVRSSDTLNQISWLFICGFYARGSGGHSTSTATTLAIVYRYESAVGANACKREYARVFLRETLLLTKVV